MTELINSKKPVGIIVVLIIIVAVVGIGIKLRSKQGTVKSPQSSQETQKAKSIQRKPVVDSGLLM